MRFLRPEMAVWLLTLPVAAGAWGLHFWYKRRHRQFWPLATFSRRSSRARDLAVLALSSVAIACSAGAMMRPQVRAERFTPVFDKRDLVLLLDRSVSMRARDVAPSRAARAIAEIEHFLRRKPATIDRVALIGFAGTSVVLSYPTADLDALFFYLDWLRDDPTPLFGTDMGGALESAAAVIRRDRTPRRLAPLFVLISDGEDQGARLDRTVAAIARGGVHVHTIGIGSFESVPMPVPAAGGGEEWLTDESGGILETRFDERTLQHIASMTGGRYFRSVTGGELRDALDTIVAAERRQVGTNAEVAYRELYVVLLAAATLATAVLVTIS